MALCSTPMRLPETVDGEKVIDLSSSCLTRVYISLPIGASGYPMISSLSSRFARPASKSISPDSSLSYNSPKLP